MNQMHRILIAILLMGGYSIPGAAQGGQNFGPYLGVWALPEADLCSRQFCIIYRVTVSDFFNEPGDITLLYYDQHPGGFQVVGGTLQSITPLPDGGWEAVAHFGMGDDPVVRYRFDAEPDNLAADYMEAFTGEEEASGMEQGTWVAAKILATRLLASTPWLDDQGNTWFFTVEGYVDIESRDTRQYEASLTGQNGAEVPGCFLLFLGLGDAYDEYAVALEEGNVVLYPTEYAEGQIMRLDDGKVVLRPAE